jgi:hypothetical protein
MRAPGICFLRLAGQRFLLLHTNHSEETNMVFREKETVQGRPSIHTTYLNMGLPSVFTALIFCPSSFLKS